MLIFQGVPQPFTPEELACLTGRKVRLRQTDLAVKTAAEPMEWGEGTTRHHQPWEPGNEPGTLQNYCIWVFPKIGIYTPKMDGENNGKPYVLMEDLGVYTPYFLKDPSTSMSGYVFLKPDPESSNPEIWRTVHEKTQCWPPFPWRQK